MLKAIHSLNSLYGQQQHHLGNDCLFVWMMHVINFEGSILPRQHCPHCWFPFAADGAFLSVIWPWWVIWYCLFPCCSCFGIALHCSFGLFLFCLRFCLCSPVCLGKAGQDEIHPWVSWVMRSHAVSLWPGGLAKLAGGGGMINIWDINPWGQGHASDFVYFSYVGESRPWGNIRLVKLNDLGIFCYPESNLPNVSVQVLH